MVVVVVVVVVVVTVGNLTVKVFNQLTENLAQLAKGMNYKNVPVIFTLNLVLDIIFSKNCQLLKQNIIFKFTIMMVQDPNYPICTF